jgi:hypothetical protein
MSFWQDHSTPSRPDGQDEHNISGLLQTLGRLTDPLSPQGIRHELVFVLAVAVVAVLAGACNYRQIADQAADLPQPLLCKPGAQWNWFTRRYDWPSEATLRWVLYDIDAHELDLLIGEWLYTRAHRDDDGLLVIALDGKVLRGAWTGDHDQVTLFSAMIHGKGVTIAQVKVPAGTNEITQVPRLLDGVQVREGQTLATLDAAHTQRDTAQYLKGTRNIDYIMTVKGNQPTLQAAVFDKCLPLLRTAPGHVVEERSHARIRRWSTWTTDATGIDFPHAQQLARIRRDVLHLDG